MRDKVTKRLHSLFSAVLLSACPLVALKAVFTAYSRFNHSGQTKIITIPALIIISGLLLSALSACLLSHYTNIKQDKKTAYPMLYIKRMLKAVLLILCISLITGLSGVAAYKLNIIKPQSMITFIRITAGIAVTLILPVCIKYIFTGRFKINIKNYILLALLLIFTGAVGKFITELCSYETVSVMAYTVIGAAAFAASYHICTTNKDEFKNRHIKTAVSLILITVLTSMPVITVYAEIGENPNRAYAAENSGIAAADDTDKWQENNNKTETMNEASNNKEAAIRTPKKYHIPKAPEGELVAAGEKSATYKLEDGSFITVIGGIERTYKDSLGEYRLIDNTLVKRASGYTNKANSYSIVFPESLSEENAITVTKSGKAVSIKPVFESQEGQKNHRQP